MTTLFRGPVQDAQVLPGVPRAVRVDPRRPPLLRRLLRRLQPRAPSRRARAPHARVGLLRHRSPDPSPPHDRARPGLCGQPAAVRPPADPAQAAHHRLDQPAHPGGAHTNKMTARCLTGLDSFRPLRRRVPWHPLQAPRCRPWPSPLECRLGSLLTRSRGGFLTTPQASLDAADWPVAPRPASTPGSRPTPGAALPGTLASPRTGLPPAGCRELGARLHLAPPFVASAPELLDEHSPGITAKARQKGGRPTEAGRPATSE